MNSRLAVAVHVLVLLEQHAGTPVPSDQLAASANTNPTVVRRLLAALAAAGLTTAQLGPGGGALLAKRARAITLLDVYRAVDDGTLFGLHPAPPDPTCSVGRHIQPALAPHFAAATRAVERELDRTTIADVLREVGRLAVRKTHGDARH